MLLAGVVWVVCFCIDVVTMALRGKPGTVKVVDLGLNLAPAERGQVVSNDIVIIGFDVDVALV